MTKQITLEDLLEVVTVQWTHDKKWTIVDVKVTISGSVYGNILGDVYGSVEGNVRGYVSGNINGREWEYVETPIEKLERLIKETGNEELIEAFNQLEDTP